MQMLHHHYSIPTKYIPHYLNKRDWKIQKKAIIKSRKEYKKGQFSLQATNGRFP
jgi:hypothetical protein